MSGQPPASIPNAGWLEFAYRQIDPALRRYLGAMAGDRGEDLASQVWVEAIAARSGQVGGVDGLRRLVFTIARRRLIDHRRRWWQRRVVLMADPPATGDDGGEGSPDRAVDLVRQLPRAQAEVVFLRVIAGLSAAEVADITGRSAEAVRVMQHRALNTLAARLRSEPGEM
ncbi:MAG TPA: sigma factor-like helix-turn-helix DNA-binding protein [Gaiellales bacterium]|nr:sigma factor-like helix-turn-helix DNA-binding protein [Gaiellales bacterium]